MSKGGGGSTRTITQTTAAPEYAQPFLEYGLSEAKELYGQQPEYYRGPTTVGFAPESEMALAATRQRALGGSPLVSGAQSLTGQAMAGKLQNLAMPYAQGLAGGANLGESIGMMRQTARGDFLGGSPGLSGAIQRALDPVEERMQAMQSGAGRYGSGYGQKAAADAMGRVAADVAYQDYASERANQLAAQQNLAALQEAQYGSQLRGMGALGELSAADIQRRLGAAAAAPGMAELDYADLAKLGAVGAAREGQSQAELQADIERFNMEQQQPLMSLANYMATVQGGTVGGQSTRPVFRNPTGDFLSGLSGLAGIGKAFGIL
eukprot:GHVR01159221.1.p1 GENE.GHVR01159221.1~~GHVR01159221.1.p1  ORF type:complete len:321 (+),score=67.17 GHVR01159221.1:1302-2264(+)